MPIIFKTDSPMLGVWRMTECSDELLAMLGRREDYRPFLERVNAETRRREHLASRVLLARLLGYEAQVGYRQDGAPFLFGSSLHISISHTRDYAAVIVGEQPVGIDIEYRSDRVWKIRERFLSSEELAMLDPTNEVEQLLICWCVKEALFKYCFPFCLSGDTGIRAGSFASRSFCIDYCDRCAVRPRLRYSFTAVAVRCYRGRAAVNLPFVVKSETQQLVELKVAFEIFRFGYTVVISHV